MMESIDTPDKLLQFYRGQSGWTEHIRVWESMTNKKLLEEHRGYQLWSHGVLKGNATVSRRLVAAILLLRGITHIPNIFGDIPIRIN